MAAKINKNELIRITIARLRAGLPYYDADQKTSEVPEANLYFAIIEQAFQDLTLKYRTYTGRDSVHKALLMRFCHEDAFDFLTHPGRNNWICEHIGLHSEDLATWAKRIYFQEVTH